MASHTMNKNMFSTLSNDSDSDVSPYIVQPQAVQPQVVRLGVTIDQVNRLTEIINVDQPSITPFKGRSVVEITKKTDDEFPMLGAPQKNEPSKKTVSKTKKNFAGKTTRFIVGSSYINERRKTRNNGFQNNNQRSQAFAKMENKEDVAKTLTCTRACNNVKRSDGEYGVCYRETCSFAHSLDELNDPMCSFGATCRHKWGKRQRDGSVDSSSKCRFRHSDESREDWTKRANRTIPDLPQTSEMTRKPMTKKPVTPQVQTPQVQTPQVRPPTPHPEAPKKAPANKLGVRTVVLTPTTDSVADSVTKQLDMGSQSDSESDDSYQMHYRNSRSRSPLGKRKRTKSSYPNSRLLSHTVRVPTNELAELAIKEAFSKGVFNLHVIVE